MKNFRLLVWAIVACVALGSWGVVALVAEPPPAQADQRKAAQKQMDAGNFKDAYDAFRKLALDPADDPSLVDTDLNAAILCLQRLNRVEEIDAFREAVIAAHSANWQLLMAAAESYRRVDHYGFLVAGVFERGNKRGGGEQMHATDRDRVRSLQLFVQALPLLQKQDNTGGFDNFYLRFAEALLINSYSEAWRLQALTDLKTLPDYDKGWYWYGGGEPRGAPVDADGQPIYYSVPKSFDDAKSDGERWRWAIAQAAEFGRPDEAKWQFANFLLNQFGVQTMAQYGYWFGRGPANDDGKKNESGTYALDSLGEDETIARLATGIKRFKLPDEFNPIKVFQQIAESKSNAYRRSALDSLAQVFENRRQYPRAAEYWTLSIKEGNPDWRPARLKQIVDNWGRFDGGNVQPAGQGATLEYRFRNGKRVEFEAHAIKVDLLLDDVKAYLKSQPKRLDWEKFDISNLGYRLVEKNQTKYIGDSVAQWSLDLEPRARHFDKRVTVTTPLQKAGAYLVTAKLADGNTSRIIVWISDMVIAKKPLAGKSYVFVADAVTGKPIPKANVEFFGYRQRHVKDQHYDIDTTNFAESTDDDGQVMTDGNIKSHDYSWLITARAGGRMAYLGFTNIWNGDYYDAQYNETKVFTITDRPVYRPSQSVKFKFWIGHAQYDKGDEPSAFANQTFHVEIHNPKGDKVFTKTLQSDAYGGLDGEYELPADATLGQYQVLLLSHGGAGHFRVEEYKKPEYEVKVEAPTEPVMLGEKITATIEAKYYFGAPVTEAKVKYKVLRSTHDDNWYPVGIWDWFYGPGYWWFAYDYDWYPGWHRWGCMRPIAWWWPRSHTPPEVVAEAEVSIGADGKVKVEIDTAIAKELHGDEDHSYSITAEVVDASRRTIVGQGNVLVAREPFKVYAWVNRGYYRVGDTIDASFSAHTLDRKPVKGQGRLKLFKISYNDQREPVETEVQAWDLATNDQGEAQQKLTAATAGQYRLSHTVTDSQKHAIEGGYVFTVIGEGFDAAQYRFNHLEIVPDKREYADGETAKLLINTDRVGSTVLLFLRPSNGMYLPPKVLRLDGRSTTVDVGITKKDMPNIFVEAVTIADGKLHTEAKELVIPPEQRVLNVKLEPSAEKYKPGQKAEVKLTLTDYFGKPFVGSTVLSIYDKSVEYISGGSNVPEIKAFFWKWRRSHHPHTESSLQRWFDNLLKSGQVAMNDLGVFGGNVAEEGENFARDKDGVGFGGGGGMGGGRLGRAGGMRGEGRMMMKSAAAPGSAMPMNAPMAEAASDMVTAALDRENKKENASPGGQAPMVEPTVRSNFADTALWVGALTTDGDGVATVKLDMPENLSTWKVKSWAIGKGTRVGQGEVEVITTKNLLLRLQAPRFFVQTDEVVLSANVHNYLDTKKSVRVVLELDGPTLETLGAKEQTVEIAAGGEARVDFRVKALDEGQAVVRMKALSDEESDAMEQKFPVYIHGMLKMDSFAGAIRPEGETSRFTFTIPAERREAQTRLEIRYSPSLAAAMVDALPYMAEYPYGCTEQTLNRFLPTVITQKVLQEMHLDLKAIQEKRTNLNAQEIGDDQQRAKGWKRFDRNPVFDEAEVSQMVKDGLRKLTDMQLSDGGWGWFSGYGEHSYPHTTATVVHGLQVAKANDVAIVPGVLERGIEWLKRYQDEQVQLIKNWEKDKQNIPKKPHADDLDALVYMVLADADVKNTQMLKYLDRDRTHLSVYAKGLFGLALHQQGEKEKLAIVMENISQYVQQDDENQTAWLKTGDSWWYWYNSEIEAMACYVKLLSRTDPKSEVASRMVKYLLNNRKHATYWTSTRDTALCIEALAEYLKASGQTKPDMTVEILVDGKVQKEVKITAENLFTFDNKLVMVGDALEAGRHTVEFRKRGTGPLYYNAYVTNFTLEPFIEHAGLEVKVDRHFYKLNRVDKTTLVSGARGQAIDQKVEKYERQEIPNLATLTSGDLVEIELVIDSKNDYEYLLFEDMKAAGFEPVDVRSGYNGNSLGAYMELRDNRVVFFVRQLARGKHSVSYRLRAEIPGKFSALPARAEAMYAPELKGNSDEMKVEIVDKK